MIPESTRPHDDATETALRTDPRLTEPQKRALLAVYRSYIEANDDGTADDVAKGPESGVWIRTCAATSSGGSAASRFLRWLEVTAINEAVELG